jgi:S-adenosyl-L-methionine hydrolase (adenosine-forming)
MHAQVSTFNPSGIITLMTDFGLSEPYAAIMKGVILTRCPTAQLIDLTHQVPPFQTGLAGFWLARSWQYFPVGTVHLAVVDPGVGTERGMVILETGGQVFVAPDNDLLEPVFRSASHSSWRTFSIDDLAHLGLHGVSHTFHGRDIFSPLVAEIITGSLNIESLGQPKSPPSALRETRCNEGRIIGADHFGNLITDIPAAAVLALTAPVVLFRGRRLPIHKTYGNVPAGELLALINSWGTVEIAEAQGNAQRTLAAMPGELVAISESSHAPV